MDTFSLSDPLGTFRPDSAPGGFFLILRVVVLYEKKGDAWSEVGRTEMIKDTLNPQFVRSFKLGFRFEEVQFLRFVCYDIDDINKGLEKQDLIGEVCVMLSEVVTAPGQKLVRPLRLHDKPTARRGLLAVSAEEVQELNTVATISMHAEKLDKKDLFGKSDPFVIISRCKEDGIYVPVAKTEVIRKDLNPRWKSFDISLQRLCNGDLHRPIKFEVFDWNRSGKHEFIGSFTTTVNDLQNTASNKRHSLINQDLRARKARYVNSGTLVIDGFTCVKQHTFLDYIRGGCEINLITAIDFTASNGNPMFPNSLHFTGATNAYAKAIMAVGNVLTPYDDDQNFPCFGFGAKLPPSGRVSHCFALNGNEENPEVKGLDGILQAYNQTLSRATLYGPTIFSQVLCKAFEMAGPHCTQDVQRYQILMLLTDGVLDDLEASIDEIVRKNDMPLSIIIVGVGSADFSKMEVLDADDSPMRSTWGETARRDIVQFVPFNQFKDRPHDLAKAVLEEVPGQLLSYFKMRGIVPNPPKPAAPPAAAVPSPYGAYPADAFYAAGPHGQYSNYLNVGNA